MNAFPNLRPTLLGVVLVLGGAAGAARADDGKPPDKPAPPGESKYYKPDPKREIPWAASADPSTAPADGPKEAWAAIALGGPPRKVIYPLLPGPVAAVPPKAPKGQKDEAALRVYDLRTGRPVGKSFDAKIAAGEHAALAADGSYLAFRPAGRENPHTVNVIDTATGESVRRIEAGRDKEWSLPIAFVGPGRLLTQTHEGQNPDFTEKTEYKLWDVKTGDLLSEFAFDLVWTPTSVGISPGGKYIVFRLAKTQLGQRLVVTEIATGKVVGDISFVGKDEPFGGSAGVEFSPDGKELAVLWHYLGKKKGGYGKVLVFDAATGKKLASHDLADVSGVDTGSKGGLEAIQWVPDGSGWLLFGSLLIDRQTGKELGRVGGDKKLAHLRRFVGPGHLTAFKGGLDSAMSLEPAPTARR